MSRNHVRLDPARWHAAKIACHNRDGWRCVQCRRAGRLEADHIEPLKQKPEQDPYRLAGLQTLCRSCHIEKTGRENRRALSPAQEEWRNFVMGMVVRAQ